MPAAAFKKCSFSWRTTAPHIRSPGRMRARHGRNRPPQTDALCRWAGRFPNGLSGSFGYNCDVFTLNPAFVEIETSDTRSLLEQAHSGDTKAFGEVCRVYETRLLRQAIALCGDATLAEDLVQDTLVEAWRCLRRYNGRCRFLTWLCAILLNRYRNSVREKRPMPFSAFPRHARNDLQNSI